MERDLIVKHASTGIEIALLEDRQLVELHEDRPGDGFSVGDVFLGKVRKTIPGLNAAFVDIGMDKDAFLHYTDLSPQILSLRKYTKQLCKGGNLSPLLQGFEPEPDIDKAGKIGDVLHKGDLLPVQILKEPISGKGARLSCEITLAGSFVVLAPFTETVAVSRKIKDKEERERLQRLTESIKPAGFGLIVRTAAQNKTVAELHGDINGLLERWKDISFRLRNATPPEKMLSEVSKTSGILRDLLGQSFNSIVVDDRAIADDIKNTLGHIEPGSEKVVKLYKGKSPLFEQFGVNKQIKLAFGKTVNMPSGAHLVIENTEAMHVVDVNSGHRVSTRIGQESQSLAVNLEAVNEIARQLRLRDLGGIVVIDFIDMKEAENRQMVLRRMKEAMEPDRARHTILPLSKFCLMQITRQRVRPEIQIDTAEQCPSCKGTGKVNATILLTDEIFNNLRYLTNEMDRSHLKLVLHPFVEAYLKKGVISIQWKWFWQLKRWVAIEGNKNFGLTEYRFYDSGSDEIRM